MFIKSKKLRYSIVLFSSFLLFGCGEKRTADFTQDEIVPLSCVVVMPTKVPYEYAAKSREDSNDLRSGALFLEDTLRQKLQDSKVSRIIDPSQLRNQAHDLSGGTYKALQIIGEQEQCEAALLSTISRFSKRQGGEYAVDEPASAAFDLKLIDTKTGRNLWMSSFNETQVSLLSNLLSFNKARSRGFKWITVEELVARGAQEKLQKCAYLY